LTNADTTSTDALASFAHLGMFTTAADPALFPLGRVVEVMAMGSWYRGVVVKPVTAKRARLGVEYTSGAGETRLKDLSLSRLISCSPLGRQKRGNPGVKALGVRIPAALADVPAAAVEEAVAEKIEQGAVTEAQVMAAIRGHDHEYLVNVVGVRYYGHIEPHSKGWGDYRSAVEPAQVAHRLGVQVKTHGAAIRRALVKLAKSGQLRIQLHGSTRAYSAVLTEEQAEAAISAIQAESLVHEPTTDQLAKHKDLTESWLNPGTDKPVLGYKTRRAGQTATYEQREAFDAELVTEAVAAARAAGARYLWILGPVDPHRGWRSDVVRVAHDLGAKQA